MKHLLLHSIFIIFSISLSSQEIHTLYSISSQDVAEGLKVNNLEAINSNKLDYCAIPFGEGIIFTSNRTENLPWYKRIFSKVYSNLLFTVNTGDGKFIKPFSLSGEVNGEFNEGAACISTDGKKMFFTRNASKKNQEGLYDLNIYSAELIDHEWENIKEIDLGAKDYTNCHPVLSKDNQTLYFSSNRPGGFGGMDIYKTHLVEGEWITPINLGPSVNSKETELFPQIGFENELYFSSDAENGHGQLDIWVSKLGDTGARLPKLNMGPPINSPGDDFSFLVMQEGQSGYLTSNRKGGMGLDDIYSWEITLPIETQIEEIPAEENIFTTIDITNQTNTVLSSAQLTLIEISYDLVDVPSLNQPFFITNNLDKSLIDMIGKKIDPISENSVYKIDPARQYFLVADHPNFRTTQQVVSGETLIHNNSYAVELSPINEDYLVLTNSTPRINPVNGPFSENTNIINPADMPTSFPKIEEETPVVLIAAVPPVSDEEFTSKGGVILETDKAIVKEKNHIPLFSSIYHAFNKYILDRASKEELSDVVSTLRQEIKTTVLIEAHTDTRGNEAYNKKLSQKRAKEVKLFLVEQGIEPERITAIGYGSSRPLIDCSEEMNECSEETHQKNRRTEIILTPNN